MLINLMVKCFQKSSFADVMIVNDLSIANVQEHQAFKRSRRLGQTEDLSAEPMECSDSESAEALCDELQGV